MKHLFKNLNINNFDVDDIASSLQEDMSKSDVSLTFKWTKNKNLLFYKLHLKASGKTVDLLKGLSMNNSEGAFTFFIGSFDNDMDIEINYGILALVSIPKCIVLLSQTNPTGAFQVSPKVPGSTNSIDSGKKLEDTIKYKVK